MFGRTIFLALLVSTVSCEASAEGQAAMTEVLTLGQLEGSTPEVFGIVKDVALDADGGIWVSDMGHHVVRHFGRDGSFVGEIGARGAGPWEFQGPDAITVADGEAFVLDIANGKVSRIARSPEGLQRVAEYRLALAATNIARCGESLWALGYHDGALLHRLNLEGEIIRSYPGVLPEEVRHVEWAVDSGNIACGNDDGGVLVLPTFLPWIITVEEDGRISQTELPDYLQVILTSPQEGAVRYSVPDQGYYNVGTSVERFNGEVWVQIGRLGTGRARSPGEISSVTTFALHREGDSILWSSDSIPRLRDINGNFGVSLQNAPHPVVVVFEVER